MTQPMYRARARQLAEPSTRSSGRWMCCGRPARERYVLRYWAIEVYNTVTGEVVSTDNGYATAARAGDDARNRIERFTLNKALNREEKQLIFRETRTGVPA